MFIDESPAAFELAANETSGAANHLVTLRGELWSNQAPPYFYNGGHWNGGELYFRDGPLRNRPPDLGSDASLG